MLCCGKLTLHNLHLHLHWLSIGGAALVLATLPCVCQSQGQEGFGRSPCLTRDCLDCLFPDLEQLNNNYQRICSEFNIKDEQDLRRRKNVKKKKNN